MTVPPVYSGMVYLHCQLPSHHRNDPSPLQQKNYRTGLVYDERMTLHKCSFDLNHVEHPDRVSKMYDYLQEEGLVSRCVRIIAGPATEEVVLLVHSPEYIAQVQAWQKEAEVDPNQNPCKLEEGSPTYLSPHVYSCAMLAVGCAIKLVEAVLQGEVDNGLAIIRPPGHHAEMDEAVGFCFFNNTSIAARYAQTELNVKRILILDWDIHHGNGTQHAFYTDPSVLYLSLHRYDQGKYFPYMDASNFSAVGEGKGEGFNVNVAWNKGSEVIGDLEYIAAFHRIVLPVAQEFNPDLVLVSCGFDAAKKDPLGRCNVTPGCYAYMTHHLKSLAQGKLVLILEGGYNVQEMSQCMAACSRVLLGEAPPTVASGIPTRISETSIANTIQAHRKYWKCLQDHRPSSLPDD
ncbi:histone deacetylase 6-like isoform X1 [Branchiostoma floridae]|uniref:histone deacetylase n=1 Tax=Branchiostoma floridae TaxID=7739 RepID=A0A9J7MP46_BRAFL|nr:histone deacetylase 6-like isoform X1 [Branchiostoma floridae]